MHVILLFVLCAFSAPPLSYLMHQLTTGVLPFYEMPMVQLMKYILYAPILHIGGGFSLALEKAIVRMLEKVFFFLWGVMFFLLAGTGEEADGG
jgi:hypothetical protein